MAFGAMHNIEVAAMLQGVVWPTQAFNFEPSLFHALQFSLFDVFFRYDSNTTFSTALWTISIELYGSAIVFTFLFCVRAAVARYCLYPILVFAAWRFDSPFLAFFLGLLLADLFALVEVRRIQRSRAIMCLSVLSIALGMVLVTFGRPLYNHPAFVSFCAFLFVGGMCHFTLERFPFLFT